MIWGMLRDMLETLIWVGVDRNKARERKLHPVHIAAAGGHIDTELQNRIEMAKMGHK